MSSAPRTRSRSATRLAAVLFAVTLASTACSSDSGTPSAGPSPSGNSTSPAMPAKKWPFTGKTAGKLPNHRAAIVKIENTSNSEPQLGLGSADMVVEELVEGGLTRLAAFYYSSLPSQVGPVRSMRATDIAMVKPAHAVLVASGGSPRTTKQMRRAKVLTAPEGTGGYYRVGDRPAPYNLFMHLNKLPKDKLKGPRPPAYLPWGSAKGLSSGKPAKHVTAEFSGSSITQWTWNGTVWHRSGSHAKPGDDFRPDNILALEVKQISAGYVDAAGNPVPESVLTGKGKATLFHDGRAYQATWKKKSATSTLKLVSAKGKPVPVPPGHTWIELVPASSSGSLRYGK